MAWLAPAGHSGRGQGPAAVESDYLGDTRVDQNDAGTHSGRATMHGWPAVIASHTSLRAGELADAHALQLLTVSAVGTASKQASGCTAAALSAQLSEFRLEALSAQLSEFRLEALSAQLSEFRLEALRHAHGGGLQGVVTTQALLPCRPSPHLLFPCISCCTGSTIHSSSAHGRSLA